jgi:hypothetical protein
MLPFRDDVIGPGLINAIFRVAVKEEFWVRSQQKGYTQKMQDDDFAELVYSQPEFRDLKGSTKSIKDQYIVTMRSRARFHGWMDANGGYSGNCSNHAGELDQLDKNIQIIVMDLERRNAENELKETLGTTEQVVLVNGVTDQSRKNRQKGAAEAAKGKSAAAKNGSTPTSKASPASTSSNSSGGSGGGTSLGQAVDAKLAEMIMSGPGSGVKRKRGAPDEAGVERKLLAEFKYWNGATLVAAASLDQESELMIDKITIPLLVSLFCSDESPFDSQFFKINAVEVGLPVLEARKLFLFFKKASGLFGDSLDF